MLTIGLTVLVNELFYQHVLAWICGIPCLIIVARSYKRYKIQNQTRKLNYEFCEALSSFSVALQAGYSAENALRAAKEDLKKVYGNGSDLVNEFQMMEHQMNLSIPLEKLFWDLAIRSTLEDFENFAAVFESAKRNGGNMELIIRRTARMIGDKIDVYREIETILAAKKTEQLIMTLMPCAIILYLHMTSPGLMDLLYGNLLGALIMTICLCIYVFAWWLGNRIIEIQV